MATLIFFFEYVFFQKTLRVGITASTGLSEVIFKSNIANTLASIPTIFSKFKSPINFTQAYLLLSFTVLHASFAYQDLELKDPREIQSYIIIWG